MIVPKITLGSGTYGHVQKVEGKDGQFYACKIINLRQVDRERSMREVKILQELNHTYIIKLKKYWTNGQNLFIVSELYEGLY